MRVSCQGAYIHSPAGTGRLEGQGEKSLLSRLSATGLNSIPVLSGQVWWDANKNAVSQLLYHHTYAHCTEVTLVSFQSDLDAGTLRRPILWVLIDSHHVVVDGISINESPNWNVVSRRLLLPPSKLRVLTQARCR